MFGSIDWRTSWRWNDLLEIEKGSNVVGQSCTSLKMINVMWFYEEYAHKGQTIRDREIPSP